MRNLSGFNRHGRRFSGTLIIQNVGALESGNFKLKVVLSQDRVMDSNDLLLYFKSVESIQSERSVQIPISFKIERQRFHNVIACADANLDVLESDEGNNFSRAEIPRRRRL